VKKHFLFLVISILILLFFSSSSAFAQNNQTRLLKQHKLSFAKAHLEQTEIMLLQAIESNSVSLNSSAVQTIRELEEIFPTESFSVFIEPLSTIIQNEKADTQLRILSALALDKLHSDFGDEVIYEVAKTTSNESVKNISTALSIESFKADNKINSKVSFKYE
jgi:hypothetical protein